MGQQVARAYCNLGKVSGDETSTQKGVQILEDEIMRYAAYLRFYQSLNPSQYERLTRIDKIIDQQYMLDLLGDYGQQCGDEKYEALAKKLVAAGVNMDRLQSYQKAYEQAMMRQMQAQQAAADEGEPSVDLEGVLGN